MLRQIVFCAVTFGLFFASTESGWSQVVQFRLETTDMVGTPVDSITVGEEFLLQTYTQHVGGFESAANSGVFAGYLDISYDATLASVAGPIKHGQMYANVKTGDLSVPGVMDNIGGVSSSGPGGFGLDPLGVDEQFLFSVPMLAVAPGQLSFVGSETLSYPVHDVLVYGLNEPVSARDVDFGAVDTRIDFGAVMLNVVPEPQSIAILLIGVLGVLSRRSNRTTG